MIEMWKGVNVVLYELFSLNMLKWSQHILAHGRFEEFILDRKIPFWYFFQPKHFISIVIDFDFIYICFNIRKTN